MIVIVPKWNVVVSSSLGRVAEFNISDNHVSNVLAMVSKMEFTSGGVRPINAVIITLVEDK